jgi:hypothetical protein
MVASERTTGGHVRFICFQTWDSHKANIYPGVLITINRTDFTQEAVPLGGSGPLTVPSENSFRGD